MNAALLREPLALGEVALAEGVGGGAEYAGVSDGSGSQEAGAETSTGRPGAPWTELVSLDDPAADHGSGPAYADLAGIEFSERGDELAIAVTVRAIVPGILADRQLDAALRELASGFEETTAIVTAVRIDAEAAAELSSVAADDRWHVPENETTLRQRRLEPFTAAHSLTLAPVALGLWSPPSVAVEAVIAGSIACSMVHTFGSCRLTASSGA